MTHPVGHLFLQYHALFALERREWTVLRALLKAAVGAAQARSSKTSRGTKTPTSPTPPASSASQTPLLTFGFRWRPECLQALALGIASLPASSDESATSESTQSADTDKPSSSGAVDSQSPPAIGGSGGSGAGTPSVVTRAELASLLRASLPLQTDLQLLVLAQAARLVPATAGSGTATPGAGGPVTPTPVAATPIPNFFPTDIAAAARPGGGEREKLINTLSRHVEVVQQSDQEPLASPPPTGASTTTPVPGAVFKTSNAKVVEALEVLKRDLERATSVSSPLWWPYS